MVLLLHQMNVITIIKHTIMIFVTTKIYFVQSFPDMGGGGSELIKSDHAVMFTLDVKFLSDQIKQHELTNSPDFSDGRLHL